MLSRISRPRYLAILVAVFLPVWIGSAIRPIFPHDWIIENVLVVFAFAGLAFTYRAFPLSRLSYTLIFVFLCLHEIGAHYTYAEVPYDRWWESLFGRTFNSLVGWERNNFDRIVHFSYGFLLAYPIREMFVRVAAVRGFWGYFLPLDLAMSTSMIYELIEWAAAVVFGGELGQAYLGTQGDVWDAHKDMALASLGALIAMSITAAINARYKRDFAQDFASSLQIKSSEPLGEEALARLRSKN